MSWENRITDVIRRYELLTEQLADPSVLAAREKLREVAREHSELAPIAQTARQLERIRTQLADARQMMASSVDIEMVELAEAEVVDLAREEERLLDEIRQQLTPKDPLADRAAVVEIRAGTGGDEAGLFAGDLFRMYSRYAERRGWKIGLMTLTEGERGSIK
jgi:peptide chain release factor 1